MSFLLLSEQTVESCQWLSQQKRLISSQTGGATKLQRSKFAWKHLESEASNTGREYFTLFPEWPACFYQEELSCFLLLLPKATEKPHESFHGVRYEKCIASHTPPLIWQICLSLGCKHTDNTPETRLIRGRVSPSRPLRQVLFSIRCRTCSGSCRWEVINLTHVWYDCGSDSIKLSKI